MNIEYYKQFEAIIKKLFCPSINANYSTGNIFHQKHTDAFITLPKQDCKNSKKVVSYFKKISLLA